MNWKRLSPFAIPPAIRLAVVIAACVVLTSVLLVPDPARLLGWFAIRGSREIYQRTPDWMQHFAAYLLFSVLLQWYAAGKARWFVPMLAGFAIVHAAATEYLQRFVPDRTSDLRDLVVNFAGIASGLLVAHTARLLFETWSLELEPTHAGISPRNVPVLAAEAIVVTEVMRQERVAPTPPASPAACGLSRDAMSISPGELKPPRVLNFGFLGGLCAVGVTLLGTLHVVHGWQVKRHAGSLMELGRKAQADGNLQAARDYFARYVGMRPTDVAAMADYGLLLDKLHGTPQQSRQVFMVYEDVLRADPTREEIRRRQIEIAMEAGRAPDALIHVRVLRQSYPTDGKLDYQAGRCFEELAEYDSAMKSYEQALEHSPDLLDAYARLAWLCQTKLERPARAHKLLDEMVERFRKSPTSWLTRGKFRTEYGSREAALSDLEEAQKLAPESFEVLEASASLAFQRASAARAEGRDAHAQRIVAEARQLLRRGIERHPDQLALPLLLVSMEAHFGSPVEAQRLIEELLKISPKNTQAQLLLADMNIAQGQFEQAKTAIGKLPRTPGTDALRLFLEGRLLMSQHEWKSAIGVLEEGRRITSEASGLMERMDLALAQCHGVTNDDEAQSAAFRRALKTNPVSLPARLGLAAVLLKQQRVKEAIAEFRPLAHLPQVRLQLARLLLVRNLQLPELAREWGEIETLLEQAKQQNDDPVNEVLLRAELLAARGQIESARRVIDDARVSQTDRIEFLIASSRLAEQAGESKQARLAMGQALSLAGDPSQAESLLREAHEKSPSDFATALSLLQHLARHQRLDDARALFQSMLVKQALRKRPHDLAQCHIALGEDEQAIAVYQSLLETQPLDVTALRGLTELHLRQQQLDAAAPLLSRLIDGQATLPPSEVRWARRQLAVILAGRGVRHPALALLDRNEQEGSATTEDQRARAFVLASSPRLADQQAALALLSELDDQSQLLPKDRWLLGRLLDATDQSHEADTHFRTVLAELPNHLDYQAEYVGRLIRRSRLDEAATRLESLPQQPTSFALVSVRVQLAAARGEADSALKTLEAEVASAGDDAARLSQLATLADRIKLHELAERLQRRAAEREPRFVIDWVRALARRQQVSAAFEVCQSEWARLPAEAAAPLALSLLAFAEGRAERLPVLEAKLVKAVEQNPRSTSLLVNLADLRCWQERYGDAEELYRRALRREPNHAAAANNLAWLLALQQRELDEASHLIEKLIGQHGPNPQLLDTRGCVFLALRRAKPALSDFSAANEEASSPAVLLHLALAQAESSDLAAAHATFAQAQRLGLKGDALPPLERPWLKRLEQALSSEQASRRTR